MLFAFFVSFIQWPKHEKPELIRNEGPNRGKFIPGPKHEKPELIQNAESE